MTKQRSVNYWGVIPAAGHGVRMGGSKPKQYLSLSSRPLIHYAINSLLHCPRIKAVLVALAPDDKVWDRIGIDHPKIRTTMGGEARNQSVLNALLALQDEAKSDDWVLVHDAVRPGVTWQDCLQFIEIVGDHPCGALLALPVRDTLKRVDGQKHIIKTLDRSAIWQAQTPQMFRFGLLLEALQVAIDAGAGVTDEASAVERLGQQPLIVAGKMQYLKITWPEDIPIVERLLQEGRGQGIASMRVGHGFDAHRFCDGMGLKLAGVWVVHDKGVLAHSDGDVVIHALCDALLGAAALGDIGMHFPDTDGQNKNRDSRTFLRAVHALLQERGWKIANIDITVIAEAPKIAPYREAMCENLAQDLALARDAVSIKATSTEKMGYLGRGEGIAAHAYTLLTGR